MIVWCLSVRLCHHFSKVIIVGCVSLVQQRHCGIQSNAPAAWYWMHRVLDGSTKSR